MNRHFRRIFLLLAVFLSPVNCQSPTKEWEKKQTDIFFIADTSASVWIVDYKKQLQFIANLVADMDIGSQYTRVGLGLYSDKFTVDIPLNNTLTKENLKSRIIQAPFQPADGYLSRGLDGMRTKGLTPNIWRPNASHISVLFTDDSSRFLQLAYDNATLAKKEGIYLFTVSIGRRVSYSELSMISSDPAQDYIFEVNDFDSLANIKSLVSTKLSQVEFLPGDQGNCGAKTHLDILFVFDEYGYGKLASNKIKKFLQNVSEDLSINSGHVRVGLVSKTCHEGEITFIQNLKREKLIESLSMDEGPDISTLLRHVRFNVFENEKGARDFATRRLVAFLYGDTSKNIEVYREFRRIQYDGIEVFIVYTNTDHNKQYVQSLAKSDTHILYMSSTDELLKNKQEFLKMFCKDI